MKNEAIENEALLWSTEMRSRGGLSVGRDPLLVNALLHIGLPVLDAPGSITRLLQELTLPDGAARLLGPDWLRRHIRAAEPAVRDTCTADVLQAGPLLAYCLEDVDDEAAEAGDLLNGLPLVPLASGGLGTLQSAGDPPLASLRECVVVRLAAYALVRV